MTTVTGYVHQDEIRSKRVKITLALLIMQAYDLWITFEVLQIGGLEMNPVAKILIGLGLVIPLKMGVAFLALYKAKYGKPSRYKWNDLPELPAYGVAWFVTGIYALVCVLNTVTYFTYA